ncbi:hypothetical protein AAVH_07516 [Aphelenchoides avenae]|nr:hypothetical protein AAVH_07516 [Aphelenchus avenae]
MGDFKRLCQKMLNQKKMLPTPEYEGPVQKRIVLLGTIRELADQLVKDCEEILRAAHQEDNGRLRFTVECVSISSKMLSNAVRPANGDYATFLENPQTAYDIIGRAQRKLQHELQAKVIDPLKAWMAADYVRINGEIEKLHERKWDVDRAREQSTKYRDDPRYELIIEQTSREFDRQMEAVKVELIKLSEVRKYHAKIFANFVFTYAEYAETVSNALNQQAKGASKESTQRK